MSDKFQQLISDCQVAAAVLGVPALNHFEFILADAASVSDITRREDFIGLIGLAGLNPPKSRTAFAVALDEHALSEISKRFLTLMKRAITHVEQSFPCADWNEN